MITYLAADCITNGWAEHAPQIVSALTIPPALAWCFVTMIKHDRWFW